MEIILLQGISMQMQYAHPALIVHLQISSHVASATLTCGFCQPVAVLLDAGHGKHVI